MFASQQLVGLDQGCSKTMECLGSIADAAPGERSGKKEGSPRFVFVTSRSLMLSFPMKGNDEEYRTYMNTRDSASLGIHVSI